MIKRKRFLCKVRKLGYSFKKSQKRTELYRKSGITDYIHLPKSALLHEMAEPFGLFVVLKRKDGRGEDHWPHRLAILFIGGDGFTRYDALYCQRDGTPPPYLAVVQDDGISGNYDRFGRDGLLERIARRCSVRPEFLLIGEPSESWTGYENTGASPEPGGMNARPRRLFRRVPR